MFGEVAFLSTFLRSGSAITSMLSKNITYNGLLLASTHPAHSDLTQRLFQC